VSLLTQSAAWEFCGTSQFHDEEGFCRQHLAERWGVKVTRIHHLIKSRDSLLEAGTADSGTRYLDCGVGKSNDQIIPMGIILTVEDAR